MFGGIVNAIKGFFDLVTTLVEFVFGFLQDMVNFAQQLVQVPFTVAAGTDYVVHFRSDRRRCGPSRSWEGLKCRQCITAYRKCLRIFRRGCMIWVPLPSVSTCGRI